MINHRVNKTGAYLVCLAFITSAVPVTAQSGKEVKNIFAQAESYYIYEEYELANQLYLLIETPDNMNLRHKIGTCYLNIPGEKEKSIPYLEEAVKNSSYDSKTESMKEVRAPLDVYFSLAKAYMINNEFDKALNTLQTFKKITGEAGTKGKMENMEFIDQQIQACRNAIQFIQVPVVFGKEALGDDFNLGSINENPSVSYDGNTIVYTERRGIENAIFFSKKINGRWETPVEITDELNAGTDCSSTALNYDGTELFLYKTDNYDGAIYSSTYVDDKWTPIKKLGKNINTRYYESHASVSPDGRRLYFSSNRPGGFGNLDIYVSERDNTGDWGLAVNLGPEINTSFNEDTPFITRNDSVLFFCSEGHNSMGGFDNFKSRRTGTGWNTVSNLGFPLNSADDDKFYQPANNDRNAYYSLTTGYKKKEIFYIDVDPDTEPDYEITETVSPADDESEPEKYSSVNVSDSEIHYYTVQVIALHNPVDITYFKHITDMKVMYNETDRFYRYTTGQFLTKEEAHRRRSFLLKRGYPDQIFVKKVSK